MDITPKDMVEDVLTATPKKETKASTPTDVEHQYLPELQVVEFEYTKKTPEFWIFWE